MYEFHIEKDGEFNAIIDEVTEALQHEGFGVLTDIDVAETFKKKLGKEVGPYRILGACNPPLAYEAINADPAIGLLLPCNVVVRKQSDNRCWVGFMDPTAVLGLVNNQDIKELAEEVRSRLQRVANNLQTG